MYYLLILCSAIFFSFQFVMLQKYIAHTDNSWNSTLKFSFYTAVAGIIILYASTGFKLEITWFSMLLAAVYGVNRVLLYYFSVKAFLYANLSVYSVASMIGSLLLPYTFGIICGESLTLTGIICCILIIIALLITIDSGKSSNKASFYYFVVFVASGLVGVVSKLHQSLPQLNVDSNSFMILCNVAIALFSAILIISNKNIGFKVNFKAGGYSIAYSALNNFGNLFLLISLLHLPATVQYPIVSGGTIVFSLIISLLCKEKNTTRNYISAIIALFATILLMF